MTTASLDETRDGAGITSLLNAAEVANLLRLGVPTVYMYGRRDPERWGIVRFGRAVRFKAERIHALLVEGIEDK
jgi:hypothetical protein